MSRYWFGRIKVFWYWHHPCFLWSKPKHSDFLRIRIWWLNIAIYFGKKMNFKKPEADGINTICHTCPMCNKKGQINVKPSHLEYTILTMKQCPMCEGKGYVIVNYEKKEK